MGQPIDQALCNPKIQTSFFLSNFHIQCFILKEDKDILPRICFSSSEKKFSAITPPQQVQKYLILLVIYMPQPYTLISVMLLFIIQPYGMDVLILNLSPCCHISLPCITNLDIKVIHQALAHIMLSSLYLLSFLQC